MCERVIKSPTTITDPWAYKAHLLIWVKLGPKDNSRAFARGG